MKKKKSKKDNMEDQRLRRQMDNEKEINLKKINISTITVLKIELIYLVKIYKTQMMIKWNIYTNYKDLILVNTIQKKTKKMCSFLRIKEKYIDVNC